MGVTVKLWKEANKVRKNLNLCQIHTIGSPSILRMTD